MARRKCIFITVGLAVAVVVGLSGLGCASTLDGPPPGGLPVLRVNDSPSNATGQRRPPRPPLLQNLDMGTETILDRACEWLPSVSAGLGSAGVNGRRRGSGTTDTTGTIGLGLEKGLAYGGRIGYPSPVTGITITGYWFRSNFAGGNNSLTEPDGVFFHTGDQVRAELNIKVKVLTVDLDPAEFKWGRVRGVSVGPRFQGAWYDDEFRVDNLTNQGRGLPFTAERNRRVAMFGYGLFAKLDLGDFSRRLLDNGSFRFLPWAKVAVSTGKSPDMSYRGYELQVRLMELSGKALRLKYFSPSLRADAIYTVWRFRENRDSVWPVAVGTERIDDVDLSLLQLMVSMSAKFDWHGLLSAFK